MREPVWRRNALSATVVLLGVNVAVFVFQQIAAAHFGWRLEHYLALSARGLASGYVFQLFTFQFLHGGLLHLVLNLVTLWFFGRALESHLGIRRFLWLYFLSGFAGGLLQVSLGLIFPVHFGGDPALRGLEAASRLPGVVGASAGICGLIAAYAALAPDQIILLNFFIPLRARWLFIFSTAIAVFFILLPGRSTIAHAAHLGGLLTGWAFVRFWMAGCIRLPRLPRMPRFVTRQKKIIRLPRSTAFPKPGVRRRDTGSDDDLPSAEFMSREVDPILDKISAHGLHSLTEREREILETARARMGKS